MSKAVADVSAATFERDVLERSRQVPVVVDFWAPWCQPCRMLGPVLEEAVAAHGGRIALAKVNVDENPDLAAEFGVSGIPAVKALRDGRVVAEFVGALPRPEVEAWLRSLLPSEGEEALAEARALADSGRLEEAIDRLERLLSRKPDEAAARLQLGRLLVRAGRGARAREVFEGIPAGAPEREEAERELLLLEMIDAGETAGGVEPARQAAERDPASSAARFALAGALWSAGRRREALEQLLEIVRRDRGFRDDGARRALLAALDRLGADDPVAGEMRQRLAAVLFA